MTLFVGSFNLEKKLTINSQEIACEDRPGNVVPSHNTTGNATHQPPDLGLGSVINGLVSSSM